MEQWSAQELKELRSQHLERCKRRNDREIWTRFFIEHAYPACSWILSAARRDGVKLGAYVRTHNSEDLGYDLRQLLHFDDGDQVVEYLGLEDSDEVEGRVILAYDEVDDDGDRYAEQLFLSEEARHSFITAWQDLKARGMPETSREMMAGDCCDALSAVAGEDYGSQAFPQSALDDRAYAVACVNVYGDTLCYFSRRLRDDADLVTQAVRRTPAALGFASKRLRDDESVALAAVRPNPPAALRFVSKRLCACADFRRKVFSNARVVLLGARVPHGVALLIDSFRTGISADLRRRIFDITKPGKYRTGLAGYGPTRTDEGVTCRL